MEGARPAKQIRKEPVVNDELVSDKQQQCQFWVSQRPSNAPCEDVVFVSASCFAICDGHNGPDAAQFIVSRLGKKIQEPNRKRDSETLQQMLTEIDDELLALVQTRVGPLQRYNVARQGSCVAAALLHDGVLHTACVGDSQIVLGVESEGTIQPVLMQSHQHNAADPREQERLVNRATKKGRLATLFNRQSDGTVYIRGQVQTSRSLGDWYLRDAQCLEDYHALVDPAPDWTKADLCLIDSEPCIDLDTLENCRFAFIASDGVCDLLSPDLIVSLLGDNLEQWANPADEILERALSRAAFRTQLSTNELKAYPPGEERRKLLDDLTIIVIKF